MFIFMQFFVFLHTMRHKCRFFYLLIAMLLAAGCSVSTEGEADNGKTSADSYHQQACDLMMKKGEIDKCIELQKKAVDELRQGKSKESAVDILSQMGYIYSRGGEYLNAIFFLQEAADSLSCRKDSGRELSPEEKIDAIKLYGNTSNLYIRIGLYDRALAMSDKAIELAEGDTNGYKCDLWIMRSIIYDKQSKLDSLELCQRMAMAATSEVADPAMRKRLVSRIENFSAYTFIEYPDYRPDSIAGAIKVLERNLPSSQMAATDSLIIGRGYALLGNPSKGIAMMKAVLPRQRERGPEDLEYSLRMLSETLVMKGLSASDYEIYKQSRRLTDSIKSNQKANALIEADFRYRTSQIERDKELLEKELVLTRQRDVLLLIISILVVSIIAITVISSIRRKNRLLKSHRVEIDNLIGERIRLNREIEKMRADVLIRIRKGADEENGDSGDATHSREDESSEIFSMVLLTQDDEARFRQLFSRLYPGLLENIRARHLEISPNAELVLMLIRLRKSTDEIALALGIKRDSVIKARYRLRLLFGLTKETDLNDFIMHL